MTTKKEVELGDPHYRTGEVEQSISGVWMKFSNKKEAFRSRLPIVCAIVPFSKSLDQLRICVHAFVQLRMRRLTMELEECECPIRNRLPMWEGNARRCSKPSESCKSISQISCILLNLQLLREPDAD